MQTFNNRYSKCSPFLGMLLNMMLLFSYYDIWSGYIGKTNNLGHMLVRSFFFVADHKTRIENVAAYFRNTLYK
jgi:hypothetical protein